MTQLIADSGSTKTDWRLAGPDQPAHGFQTDGFNPYYQTTVQIADVLRTQLLPMLSGEAVSDVYFYGAGCSGPAVNPIVADALRVVLPGAQTVDVNSDMLGAARAGSGREPGIVCILGTGSNACCYDGDRITRSIQSLGFWLGDEGSGGYLGKTLVRDFFRNDCPPTCATSSRTGTPSTARPCWKTPTRNRFRIGILPTLPVLSENIAHPHVVGLVTDAFALFLDTYVSRFPEAGAWPVHFVGSVAHYFAEPLRRAVSQAGLSLGRILKAPAERLVAYHQWWA